MKYKNTRSKILKSLAVVVGDNIVLFLRKRGIIPEKRVYHSQFNGKVKDVEEAA